MFGEKDRLVLQKNDTSCFERTGSSTQQNSNCKATCPSYFINYLRQTGDAGYCRRSNGELIIDVLLWVLTHRYTCDD